MRQDLLSRARVVVALGAIVCASGCGLVLALDTLAYDGVDGAMDGGGDGPTVIDGGVPPPPPQDASDAFGDPTRWSTYADPAWGAPFMSGPYDGRFVYFVRIPDATNVPRVVRYDTTADFAASASWTTFDPVSNGADLGGNYAVTFDGRYLMLAGFRKHDAAAASAYMLRYDTSDPQAFTSQAAWELVDVRTILPPTGVGSYTGGAVVDGSTFLVANGGSGLFLRYDGGPFDAGWTGWDPDASCQAVGAACVGPYIYAGTNGSTDCVQRYDTRQPFADPSAWDSVSLAGYGSSTTGFFGTISTPDHVYLTQLTPQQADAAFDGRYRIVRHGAGDVLDAGWETFEVDRANKFASGTQAGVFDGRYIYFSPFPKALASLGGALPGTVFLRYDTTLPFGDVASWSSLEGSRLGLGTTYHHGATFDGQYVYFAPRNAASPVVRYRATDAKSAIPPRCSVF